MTSTPDGGWPTHGPKPAMEIDTGHLEAEDHQRRENEIEHTKLLATVPIKDKL